MSPKRFLSACLILAIIFSGAVTPLFQPSAVAAALPDTPSNVSPSDNATDVILMPTLEASPYYDSDNDTHVFSDWQITATQGSYSSPACQSLDDTENLTSIVIPLGNKLSYSTTYYWHVRYQDNHLDWSDWSAEWSFTTVSAPQANFSADRTAMAVGQTITFTDSSSGGVAPLSYQWDFNNDNITDSTAQSPSHICSSAGTYTVGLKVTDAATNTATKTKTGYMTVAADLQADFSADRVLEVVGQSIQFTDLSAG